MIKTQRSEAGNPDFTHLTEQLDHYLSKINGEKDFFFKKHNHIDHSMKVALIYKEEIAIACGAFKQITNEVAEIKRMYVLPEQRSKGVASKLLISLEDWARELGFQYSRLETAKSMIDAVALYLKNGYQVIPNYAPYIGEESSICFEKKL